MCASHVVTVATQRYRVRRVMGKRRVHHVSRHAQDHWRRTRQPQTAHRLGRLRLRCGCRSHGSALWVRCHRAHPYRCTTTACAPFRNSCSVTDHPHGLLLGVARI